MPFLNKLINENVKRSLRTGVNAINFLLSNLICSVCSMLTIPFYNYTIRSQTFLKIYPYNKYVIFFLFSLVMAVSFIFTRYLNDKKEDVDKDYGDADEEGNKSK